MLWLKSFHLIFMVTWFAGLFYLPRLFIYHSATTDDEGRRRFELMEKRLLALTTIGGTLTIAFGVALWFWWESRGVAYHREPWMHAKLSLVLLLVGYHAWCWRLKRQFASGQATPTIRWLKWFNEMPTLALVGIVILVVVRPL